MSGAVAPITVPVPPEVLALRAELAPELSGIEASATALLVTDLACYNLAGSRLADVKALRRRVADRFSPICDAVYAAWKAATGARKEEDDPLARAEAHYIAQMGAWDREQERLRRVAEEENRKANAEAAKVHETKMVDTAAALEAAGQGAEAAAVLAVATAPQLPAIRPMIPPPAAPVDLNRTKKYRADVQDFRRLVNAVAAGQAPIESLSADMTFLNGVARKRKVEVELYPGVVGIGEFTYGAKPGARGDGL